jgi:phosphonate metabolism protein PhnN/1,5-bisphosphokinase (PRPP-forming)
MAQGALALVVGPSGAGKDTLIGAAREALAGDNHYVFPRRVVTRAALAALEDHDTLDRDEFKKQKSRGAFALDWDAHGLSYALPASIDAAMVAQRVVVANVSRSVIARAVEKYDNCHVLMITARPEVLAERLAARGRETVADIEARLKREGAALPTGVTPVMIDNSGTLAEGVGRFVKALKAIG